MPADAAPAAAVLPDAAPVSADIVAAASELVPDGGAAAVADPEARTLTIKKPFWGGDGAAGAPVFVARGDDPDELVRRALEGLTVKVPVGRRVLIKVNLGGFDRMRPGKADDGVTGRTTEPRLVRALVLALRARGVRNIVIADARSAPREEWPALLELSGYRALLDELDVAFVDLNHYGDGDDRPRPWRVSLPWATHLRDELILSADLVDPEPARRPFLIDVAKLKAHRFAVMSLSIKNLMGAVMIVGEAAAPPWRRRWRMHRELSPWLAEWKKSRTDDRAAYRAALTTFSERLADLYGALTPDLVLIEGLPAVAGDGFAAVVPYGGAGILIASRNGCYADFVAARFFGLVGSDDLMRELGVGMPPAIAAVAARYFGGPAGLEKITVLGDAFLPAPGHGAWYKAMAPFEIHPLPAAN